jgi:hypothetical protein
MTAPLLVVAWAGLVALTVGPFFSAQKHEQDAGWTWIVAALLFGPLAGIAYYSKRHACDGSTLATSRGTQTACRRQERCAAPYRPSSVMTEARTEYVIDTIGLDRAARAPACDAALGAATRGVTEAEADILWSNRGKWPPDVVAAATRLKDRYVAPPADDSYMQTRVQRVDPGSLEDFLALAPYAFDATFWDDETVVASLPDEGRSCSVRLTDEEHDSVAGEVGQHRLVCATLPRCRADGSSAPGRQSPARPARREGSWRDRPPNGPCPDGPLRPRPACGRN